VQTAVGVAGGVMPGNGAWAGPIIGLLAFGESLALGRAVHSSYGPDDRRWRLAGDRCAQPHGRFWHSP